TAPGLDQGVTVLFGSRSCEAARAPNRRSKALLLSLVRIRGRAEIESIKHLGQTNDRDGNDEVQFKR
ncbi:hypothetical protein THAOC_22865, partial [Thalassiosira oceanica]